MIQVEHLVKQYGSRTAVNDISFSVGDGEIVGFLGPNGAGKSTTLNIMTGYISTTAGTVTIDGHEILEDPDVAKRLIGYLPEQPPLYPDMTVNEYLNFVYELKKCNYKRSAHLTEICEVTQLTEVRHRVIGNLSKGYRQRVGIAQTLIGNPRVIILDEPTVGLDPGQVIEIRNLIRTLGRDHSVILSTHILSEVQAVCDRIVILKGGRVVADERTDEIANAAGGNRRLSVKIAGPKKEVTEAIRAMAGVSYVEALSEHEKDSTTYILESESGIDIRKPLFRLLAEHDWPILGMEARGIGLEDVFLSLLQRGDVTKSAKRRIRVKNTARGSSAKEV